MSLPSSIRWTPDGPLLFRDPVILTKPWRDWAVAYWQAKMREWTAKVGPLSNETIKLINHDDYLLTFGLWLALHIGDKELGEERARLG